MLKTARIIVILAIASFVGAIPAPALNFEEWNAKPLEEQFRYLASCADRIADAVAKTNKPLAQKIRRYYIDKAPGHEFSEGMQKLLDGLGIIIRLKHYDPRRNFSVLDIDRVVFVETAEKFPEIPKDLKP